MREYTVTIRLEDSTAARLNALSALFSREVGFTVSPAHYLQLLLTGDDGGAQKAVERRYEIRRNYETE